MLSLGVTPLSVLASVSNGPYIGLEVGGANQLIKFVPSNFSINTNGSNLDNYALGFLMRLNLGYNIDKYNGFELGTTYDFTTGHSYPNGMGNLNTNAWTLDGSYILYLPTIVEKLSVFGRLGVAYDWINNNSDCNCAGNPTVSGNGVADILGAGIKYNLSPQASFRVEWIANGLLFPVGIASTTTNVGSWTNQSFQLGINYHF